MMNPYKISDVVSVDSHLIPAPFKVAIGLIIFLGIVALLIRPR